ncbi:ATP-grasp domain-containing protein [Methylobacillus methanolivorans]|uniref:ATP-grasp domain-containing protein n=1 Tax=Methylobacillus methanolivorans TaxID=1848927 RepID=A0ABW8GKA4_9PROT
MAANVRPYVIAASAAGYQVLAADVFGDEDTLQACARHLVLDYGKQGFVPDAILHHLLPAMREFGTEDLLYGSGFEAQPTLLAQVASQVNLIGNIPEIVDASKNVPVFFQRCRQYDIPVPDTCVGPSAIPPHDLSRWLCKRQGGCGGMHIQHADLSVRDDGVYYQRIVDGIPVSLLFMAHESGVSALGFQRQVLSPTNQLPYRYGGLAGPLVLSGSVRQGLVQAARDLSATLGLRGLNSLDVMVQGEQFWVLEVNPRLSASLGLYPVARQAEWLEAHISAKPIISQPTALMQAAANLVFYAPFDIRIPQHFPWPEWAVDKPLAHTLITRDMPLCSVQAEADDVDAAEALAKKRMTLLSTMLKPYYNH